MRVHKVKDCCCGCSLETGSKIIAWLQLISGVGMMLYLFKSMAHLDTANSITKEFSHKLAKLCGRTSEEAIDVSMLIVDLLSGLFSMILGMLLCIGVTYSRPHLIRIWIAMSLTELILYPFIAITDVILGVILNRYIFMASSLFVVLMSLLLKYYCIMVVASFRKQIMSESNTV